MCAPFWREVEVLDEGTADIWHVGGGDGGVGAEPGRGTAESVAAGVRAGQVNGGTFRQVETLGGWRGGGEGRGQISAFQYGNLTFQHADEPTNLGN